MPSFDKVAKAFLEELRQTRIQVNDLVRNQEETLSQNTKMIDLLQQIKTNTAKRED
ncbi:hypothetical protein SDC9_03992 [bioreactor metagenome]|uniref:Uncharacterized protein n=1 Tax=bioreactor metagenome TaxID=1076179 RepID=A0A644SUU8_9ZZZZ|nr:hypothetical protein [Negativicutes bacterium]